MYSPGPVLEPFSGGLQAYRVYILCRRPGPVLEPFSGGVQAYRVYSLCRRPGPVLEPFSGGLQAYRVYIPGPVLNLFFGMRNQGCIAMR